MCVELYSVSGFFHAPPPLSCPGAFVSAILLCAPGKVFFFLFIFTRSVWATRFVVDVEWYSKVNLVYRLAGKVLGWLVLKAGGWGIRVLVNGFWGLILCRLDQKV